MLLAYQRRETMGSYIRVVVPELSRLESVEGESDRFRLRGPDSVGVEEHRRYRLPLQKQPGTVADNVAIRIVAPEGSRIVSAADGITVSSAGDAAEISTNLRTDLEIWVELGPAS